MLRDLQKQVVKFRNDRNWKKFHTPKNLAQALIEEVGELNSLYLWNRQPRLEDVQEEMADIAIYLLSLADVTGIDLEVAIRHKMEINGRKYPVKKCFGKDEKAENL